MTHTRQAVGKTQPKFVRAYDIVAPVYEPGAWLFSGGAIRRAKNAQISRIEPRQRVLYPGVGGAEDAVRAAERGAEVTAIDCSGGMIQQAQKKFDRWGVRAELIHGNILDHDRTGHYDVVVANFFLNCFVESDMAAMLCHLAQFVRPHGKMLIADVALHEGHWLPATLSWLYLTLGMIPTWSMGLVPWHPVYDYRKYLDGTGLQTAAVEWFRLADWGPVAYHNLTLVKSAE